VSRINSMNGVGRNSSTMVDIFDNILYEEQFSRACEVLQPIILPVLIWKEKVLKNCIVLKF